MKNKGKPALACQSSVGFFSRSGFSSLAQWLARDTRDVAVVGLIPTISHVVIVLEKKFASIFFSYPSVK